MSPRSMLNCSIAEVIWLCRYFAAASASPGAIRLTEDRPINAHLVGGVIVLLIE